MQGEKLGRFLCTLPGTSTKRPQVFKPAKKKILHLPCHELFSRLRSYDHCVSCRLWGLHCRRKAWTNKGLFGACEVTRRVQGMQEPHQERVIIKRWERAFSLENVWWKLPITRSEDLWGIQGYKLLTPAGGHWSPEEDALASSEGPPQERTIQVVLQFNEGPGGLPSQCSLCHTGTVK